MSYTVAELNDAVEAGGWGLDEDDQYGDSPEWSGLAEAIEPGSKLHEVEADYPDAWQHRTTGKWLCYVSVENPGVDIPEIGRATFVENFGGEGQGDDYWFIFRVTDADGEERLFRRSGWYASYDGGYYEGPTHEVVEARQTITVYNKL